MTASADDLAVRLAAALERIRQAWARRAEDPYGLGEAVAALIDDDELIAASNSPDPGALLRAQLPGIDDAVLLRGADLTKHYSRAEVREIGWDDVDKIDLIARQQRVPRPPGDLREMQLNLLDETGHWAWTRIADRKPGQLVRTLEAIQREQAKPPPPRKPKPPDVPSIPDVESASATVPTWVSRGSLLLVFVGSAISNHAFGRTIAYAGCLVLATTLWIRRKTLLLAAADVIASFRSGQWPKKKVAIGVALWVGLAIVSRIGGPSRPREQTPEPIHAVAPAVRPAPVVHAPPTQVAEPARPTPPSAPAPVTGLPVTAPLEAPRAPEQAQAVPPPLRTPPPVASPQPEPRPEKATATAKGQKLHSPAPKKSVAASKQGNPPATVETAHGIPAVPAKPAPSGAEGRGTNVPAAASIPAPSSAPRPSDAPGPAPAQSAPDDQPQDVAGYVKKGLRKIGIKPDPPAKNLKDEQRELHRENPKQFPYDPDHPNGGQ